MLTGSTVLSAYSPNDTAFFNINMVLITLWNTDSRESLLVSPQIHIKDVPLIQVIPKVTNITDAEFMALAPCLLTHPSCEK